MNDPRWLLLWHDNALTLARFHKEHCTPSDCGCSMWMLREMAEQAGVIFTEEEKVVFI
jgi:hypothetical protein